MKRWIHASTESDKYTDEFFNRRYYREEALLEWAEDALDEDLTEEEALDIAEEVADENGWDAFNTINEEFEALYKWNKGDVKSVIVGLDYGYGNGEMLYPIQGQEAEEAFYYWVKKYHPEADTSEVDHWFK